MKKRLKLFLLILMVAAYAPSFSQSNPAASKKAVMLNHIALHVADLEKSGKFYHAVLQLEEIPEPSRMAYTFGIASALTASCILSKKQKK